MAASAHVPGRVLAKTVIVKLDGEMAMVVLPANRKVVVQDLREATGSDQVRFASEAEFQQRFPDCETGVMPPFGNLYDMDVYLAESLAANGGVAFNACSHAEITRMFLPDFESWVKPQVLCCTT